MNSDARPAFYALAPGGWRDYVTLLHPPYTVWHLSYVAIGAAIAPRLDWSLLGWTVLAFLLAMGVGAHALDELQGRPLQTGIPRGVLVALAVTSIVGACAIGVWVASWRTWWLLAFVAAGAFVVVAYNLELFGGAFHSDVWFALAWGAFPLLTAYFACAGRLRGEARQQSLDLQLRRERGADRDVRQMPERVRRVQERDVVAPAAALERVEGRARLSAHDVPRPRAHRRG